MIQSSFYPLKSSLLTLFFIIVGNLNFVVSYSVEALNDEVINLPGSESLTLNFRQFSGYLKFPGVRSGTKYVHYWFVESMQDPVHDPVVFWTNGGPGCSGMLGMLTEQGPFRPNKDGTLSLNKYAWNLVANMVFIESPVSVGFSYSDDKSDYTTGDDQTAIDNYQTIQAFMLKFPDLLANDLYITSESYGGHYLPTLAKKIVDHNALKPSINPILNFKGFAVGNPYTNIYSGTPAMIDTFWGHQLISKSLYEDYQSVCGLSVFVSGEVSDACGQVIDKIFTVIGNINGYALDFPVCIEGTTATASTSGNKIINGMRKSSAQSSRLMNYITLDNRTRTAMTSQRADHTIAGKYLRALSDSQEYNPCEEEYTGMYLNQHDVKLALHVNPSIKWGQCSDDIDYSTSDMDVSTADIYNYLIDGGFGLNILVYSGDDDSVCATVGTQDWVSYFNSVYLYPSVCLSINLSIN